MGDTISAVEAYRLVNSGTPSLKAAAEDLIRLGKVNPMPKSLLDGKKAEAYKAFCKTYKIAIVDTPVRVGREGKLGAALKVSNGDNNSEIVKLATRIQNDEKKFAELLKSSGKGYSPGYVRSTDKPAKKKEAA